MSFKNPFSFVAGTKAKAEEVNANFEAIEAEINDALLPGLFEAGDLKPTARSAAPEGWLLCEGQAISRTTYKDLFEAIGTTYGVGDGATTFNVPDYRGRTMVGPDGAAGRLTANDALGNVGGAEKHALSTGEMPAHSHGSGTLDDSHEGNHTHAHGAWTTLGVGPGGIFIEALLGGGSAHTAPAGGHNHTIFGSTANSGGGGAHNNMQPYQVCNILIKT